MRIQFDISEKFWQRMNRYVSSEKARHWIARDALEEWITRHESRDKRYRQERLESDIELLLPIIQKMIDDRRIVFSERSTEDN